MEKKYLGSENVKLLRTFYIGELMGEIEKYDGTNYIVKVSELTDYPVEDAKIVNEEDYDAPDLKSTLGEVNVGKIDLGEPLQSVEHIEHDVIGEVKSTEPNQDVIATQVSNSKETNIGFLGSDTFNKFVDDHKFNLDAINLIIEGKQKTHKGFSFKLK